MNCIHPHVSPNIRKTAEMEEENLSNGSILLHSLVFMGRQMLSEATQHVKGVARDKIDRLLKSLPSIKLSNHYLD